jgi:fused signal recognition particle receptor
MEGGLNPEQITAAVIAAGFLLSVFLLIYAIRRARKARQRQIDEVGEDRPAPSIKKKPSLRAEDLAPEEEPPPEEEVPTEEEAPLQKEEEKAKPEAESTRFQDYLATPQKESPKEESSVPFATEPEPHKAEHPTPSQEAPKASLLVDKPRAPEISVLHKTRDVAALAPGLARTRAGWISRLGQLFVGKKEIDPSLVEEIEKVLLTADIGVRTSQKLLEEIRSSLGRRELSDPQAVWNYLKKRSIDFLQVDAPRLNFTKAKPFVLLTIGVNGSGKTTTIGKLASKLKNEGKSVLLAAGDTFRAAATEQLEVWGGRVGAEVVRGKEGSDPSSVIFEAIKCALNKGIDVVIADTAGRLHTKSNLMEELQKVRRVIGKAQDGAPHETWLVIDSTSGQNAIAQAQIFTQVMSVSGIVLTKLDGTAKGGVILGIADQLKIPVRYIGVGERVEDLREFDAEEFVEALFENANDEHKSAT